MSQPADSAPIENLRPHLPDWGVYLRWPENGNAWIHPDDLQLALSMIPSHRVFQRTAWDGTYYTLKYGNVSLRVRPSLWRRLEPIDLHVGQQVELLSRFNVNDAGIYHIVDILFNPVTGCIEYQLQNHDMPMPRFFEREDLKPIQVEYRLRPSDFDQVVQPIPEP